MIGSSANETAMGTLRRLTRGALLVGVAALGATVFVDGPGLLLKLSVVSPVYAQTAQGPVGFADIVDRVKPAVISVRVRMDASPLVMDDTGSPSPQDRPLDRFLHRYFPDNANPNGSPPPGNVVTALGSGFFISADGYAVTNNHVVQNAENVQVITDDGKAYPAKVIGTDSRTSAGSYGNLSCPDRNFPAHLDERPTGAHLGLPQGSMVI
jgi:serine protease Do